MHWKIKALIQFGMAHLPYGERLNYLAQTINGSYSPKSQLRVLLVQADYVRQLNQRFPLHNTEVVEIGPGWQALGALVLSLFGVRRIYAYDHQPHLRLRLLKSLAHTGLQNLDALCRACGLPAKNIAVHLSKISSSASLDEAIASMRMNYIAPGDASMTGLSDHSVDMVYSYGVLEHIDEKSLHAIMKESARIIKTTGRASHNIGLHDHFCNAGLGNGVNFLQYPEWIWQFFCSNALLYHNRLRLSHYLQMFKRHGLEIVWADKELLESNLEALKTINIQPRFSGLPADDLAASALYVDLTVR